MTPRQGALGFVVPRFWGTPYFRRIFLSSVFLLALVSLVPLNLLGLYTHHQTYKAILSENHLRTLRLTSNARRTLTYFMEERLDALNFIIRENRLARLKKPDELASILQHLQMGFGGFVDLGIIDNHGVQISYAGPFDLGGRDYRTLQWFSECIDKGLYISGVFLGYRKVPHMFVAVKSIQQDGSFYLLRATLDIKRLVDILASLDLSEKSEAIICNRDGLLQTPSKYYGEVLDPVKIPMPPYSSHTRVMETEDEVGRPLTIGYAYIENSPYVIMLVKHTQEIMQSWHSLRRKMVLFYGSSVLIVLLIIISIPVNMVNRVFEAERKRQQAMMRIEAEIRLASIGRLAAGVAHEINNPLAVIGENAGLIEDLCLPGKRYHGDEQLGELVEAVMESVDRCGLITKQLLRFARHTESRIEPLHVNSVIRDVLAFLEKEASYRNIEVKVDIPDDLPVIHSDRGKLQQIFLNLINNAFQAMAKGGKLDVTASPKGSDRVTIEIKDTGPGIPKEDFKVIFDPFFTTKEKTGGTGLGLAITYGHVAKLQGRISFRSKVGEGTTFFITLPIAYKGEIEDEGTAG